MSFEQYKTQVLLLHSEQSTLDSLSSGFSDRYTVHCATSGSEALNYLGDTPIHVLVTAQDLPGMSGVEALREAKKRSPETIGILLAENDQQGAEAVVGDQEVFEVVTGSVTPDRLLQLIDNATQKARLIAISDSANDTAANVDSSAEHIVMETSEHGASMISEISSRIPALDIDKAATEAARNVALLVLTKDEEFLTTVKESARGLHDIVLANTLAEATSAVASGKVGVVVIDAGMVGANIEKLTVHLRKTMPRLVPVVAGRREDGEMLMDLINRGKVYRFLLKPVSPGRARLAIEASVKHHLEAPDGAFAGGDTATVATLPSTAATGQHPAATEAPPLTASQSLSASQRLQQAPAAEAAASNELPDVAAEEMPAGEPAAEAAQAPLRETISANKMDFGYDAVDGGGSDTFAPDKTLIAAGVAVLLLIAGGIYWAVSGDPEDAVPAANEALVVEEQITDESSGVSEEELPAQATTAPVAEAKTAEELLADARAARDAGQIVNPPQNNAIELYLAAAAADPENDAIAPELDAAVQQALTLTETALLETRIEDAAAALQRIGLADPDNARLPFLNAQLQQLQLRAMLDDARLAVRETRFEDAENALAAARQLGVSDTAAIDRVAEELKLERGQQESGEMLVLANARLAEGALLKPANDNALYFFELALSNDPENMVARQGLSTIASKLVLQARTDIDSNNFADALSNLELAQQVDPNSTEIAPTMAALEAAQDRVNAENERVAAERRAQEEERARAEQAKAEEEAAALAALAAAAEEEAAATEPVAETATLDETGSDSSAAGTENDAAQTAQPAARTDTSVADNPPVSVSSLKRTKYVPPRYPRSAQRRELSGWVDLTFTVNTDGTVKDITILDSEPGDVFNNAAIKAVERWEFEPVIVDGEVSTKRAGVRLLFELQ